MSLLEIRRGHAVDVPLLAAQNLAMALETEGKALDLAVAKRGAAAVVADPGKGFYVVATRSNEPVGQLLVTHEWSDWRDATFWWIQSVYVAPNARRTGVYRALYQHVLDEARRTGGVCGVRLYADHDNAVAHATYEALGMQRAHYRMYEIEIASGET